MSAPRVLIVGSEGFVGSALLDALPRAGVSTAVVKLELTDGASVDAALGQAAPFDVLIHLAGLSHVPTCEADPAQAYRINLAGTGLVVDALLRHRPQAHLVFAGTAQVYAAPSASEAQAGLLLDETRAVRPQNTYAQTKWLSELLIRDATERRGLRATVLRLFNHTHRSQAPVFFLPHLYSALKDVPRGQEAVVPVGNLDLERDIGSISDLCGAVAALVQSRSDERGARCEVYNVCSGTPKNLRKLAELLAAELGVRARFLTEPGRVRAGEARSIVGSCAKLSAATGFTPGCRSEQGLIRSFLE